MLGLLLAGAFGVSAAGTSHAQSAGQFGPIPTVLSNPCATFYAPTGSTGITKLVYGEPVNFTIDGNAVAVLDPTETGFNLKFLISAHGQGVGGYSSIKYVFNGKLQAKANVSLTQEDVKNPAFQFNGSFKVSARVIGQGSTAAETTIAQGAQDNAVFDLWVRVRYVNGQTEAFFDDVSTSLTLTCQGSPWANQTTQPVAGTRKPAGRGFGDEWNKYAWSMQDFNGGLLVGTKNATYKYARILAYGDASNNAPAAQCYQNPGYPIPTIYKGLACAELFESPAQAGNTTDTRFAEIWRFDYAKKTWSKALDDGQSQGFRIMAKHDGKLFVGSDLGSFVAGTDLKTGAAFAWNYPGSRLLVSSNGQSFAPVPCPGGMDGPCTSVSGTSSLAPDVNVSFRALASYGGKLYLGTFNPTGGELWSYLAGAAQPWTRIQKFAGKPAVTELVVFKDRLYIGLGGGSSTGYLYTYDGTGSPAEVANVPAIASPSHIGVLKLFVSSQGKLYVGNVDLLKGFALHTLAEPGGPFTPITLNGFGDPDVANNPNAYAWSMAEIDGRVFLGTFNTSFFGNLPRGSAELWYSDDETSWTQMALPLDFGFWNYGIRGMVVANRQLFLGTASAIVAPDLIEQTTPVSAGLEIWSIRSNTARR